MKLRTLLFVFAVMVLTMSAGAWHEVEHTSIARHAVELLPDTMPAFFREGAGQIAHGSLDPDIIKLKALPQLRNAEYPEHYIDLELLDGAELPPTRYEFIKLCRTRRQDPQYVGLLPYAVVEWAQRLTVAFAEHRRWPDNPHIRAKCLVYAGILSHYLADLNQPLHTTIHWDGRAGADHRSPRSGIHDKVDGLGRKVDGPDITKGLQPHAYDSLQTAVWRQLAASHKLVDRVYELEADLPGRQGTIASQAVRDFAVERLRTSIAFSANVFLTAWEDAAKIELESWVNRDNE